MGTLSEKLTRIKDAMTQIRSGFDLENTVIESVASTTTELHASQTQTLAENAVTIQDLNTTLNARNNEINRLNATVNTQETTIQSQAQTITTLNGTVDEQVVQISTLENTIATKDATINELNETVLSKDAEIANLNARIEELENAGEAESDTNSPTYTYTVNTEEEREAITGMEANDTCYVAEESWGAVTGAVGESLNKITMDDGNEEMLNASTSEGEQVYTSDSGNITMTFSSTGTMATLTYTDTTNSTINEETGETIDSFTYTWYYDENNFCWYGNDTNAVLQLPETITYNGDGSTWLISSFVKKYGPGIYKYQGGTYSMWVRQ